MRLLLSLFPSYLPDLFFFVFQFLFSFWWFREQHLNDLLSNYMRLNTMTAPLHQSVRVVTHAEPPSQLAKANDVPNVAFFRKINNENCVKCCCCGCFSFLRILFAFSMEFSWRSFFHTPVDDTLEENNISLPPNATFSHLETRHVPLLLLLLLLVPFSDGVETACYLYFLRNLTFYTL